MRDTAFEAAVVTVVIAGGAALMWRTGGVDLPEFEVTVTAVLIVALVVVALGALLVGVAVRTSRPVDRRPQQKIGSR